MLPGITTPSRLDKDTPIITPRAQNPALMLALLAAASAYGAPAAVPSVVAAETAPATTAPKAPLVAPAVGSYDVGLMLGSQLEHNGVAPIVSVDELIRGLKEAVGGRAVTAQERDAALRFMRDARDALTEKNRAAAREFLERNAKERGVMSMPSGLQYRVLNKGDSNAKSPGLTDQVTVRYRASLADGTEFDRSDTHDRPAMFRVNSVFKGWQEAFLAMKPGAKWQLFMPAELGYGANSPPGVPPGALLVYELELLQVEPAPPMDPAAAKRPPAAGAKIGVPSSPHGAESGPRP
jgi:FKBP-type peptidyl-prolyl cis-trans isomerase FklB